MQKKTYLYAYLFIQNLMQEKVVTIETCSNLSICTQTYSYTNKLISDVLLGGKSLKLCEQANQAGGAANNCIVGTFGGGLKNFAALLTRG